MSEPVLSNSEPWPLSVDQRVDGACDRFEAAWKADQQPQIAAYLAGAAESEQPALLRALLGLELELRGKRGEQPNPAEYADRFPHHAELIWAVFAEAHAAPEIRARNSEPSTGVATVSENDAESTVPARLPDRIGRYQVRRKLGGGTFGKVYLAHDQLMDRLVAIKVPTPSLLASQKAREQFQTEAQSAARLQHEGIVRAHDFGQEDDGTCYIVYEFIEGMNLAERIKAGSLKPEEAARIVAHAAEALHYAHLQGLVHRDIKPANILLDRQGKPRITDFGLAVRERDLPNERGRLAGTLPYMAPEQVRREAHLIDGRCDIYSLGAVLYELLCGRRPFEAKTEEELEDQILHREARPPRQIRDGIPKALERASLKALSKRISDRYTTAKDLAEALVRAVDGGLAEGSVDSALPPEELERRMAAADEDDLDRLLRALQPVAEPAHIPLIFRALGHPSAAVRRRARQVVHAFGWDKVSEAAIDLARRADAEGMGAVLDGLAAFESHPEIVTLLDHVVALVKGDLRNRAILLLERKRLGLELDTVAALFRQIHSPYRIEKALGQGLFTAAYLAHAEGTELTVVVRVLRPELAGQPHLRTAFLDVHQRALHLVHEHLVLTREVRAFPERNTYFAVRDYVNGVTLQKLLESGKRFGPAQIYGILRQLLAALEVVHRRKMCHRAIKPSNVFIDEDGRVILGDVSLPPEGMGLALTRLSYDYRYVAPESFRSGGTVGRTADLYSLGCLAYELACGTPPFVSDNYMELAARHLHERPASPSKWGSVLGTAADPFLLKLLASWPEERYADVEQVRRELDRLEAGLAQPERELGAQRPPPPAAPLLHEASLARLQGAESILGFDVSVAAPLPSPTPSPERKYHSPVFPALPLREAGAAESASAEKGAVIEGYLLVDLLGRGAFGEVWRAESPGGIEVAIKIVHRPADSADIRREMQALELLKRLRHPFLLQTHACWPGPDRLVIAMELADGSLGHRLGECRQQGLAGIPVGELLTYFQQSAAALDYLHSERVLHRDVKPDNILLLKGYAKLADFGLARLLAEQQMTQTVSAGTPAYMAPEVWRGQVTKASDQYSLAATYAAVRQGKPLFGSPDQYQLMMDHLQRKPELPTVSGPEREVLQKALAKEPRQRYPSCVAFVKALERALQHPEASGAEAQPRSDLHVKSASQPAGGWRNWLAGLSPFRKRGD